MLLQLGTVGVHQEPALGDFLTSPHWLVTGATGSGKSTLVRSLLIQIREQKGIIRVADPKESGDYSHVDADVVVADRDAIAELLEDTADEVLRRTNVLRATGDDMSDEPPIVQVVEELIALQLPRRGEDAKAARDRKERVAAAIGEIVLLGRASRVHLIAISQRGDVEFIPGGGAVRDQFSLRIALGWMSADGYRMVFGVGGMEPPPRLDPGFGWISGHVGHRDGPQLFIANGAGQ